MADGGDLIDYHHQAGRKKNRELHVLADLRVDARKQYANALKDARMDVTRAQKNLQSGKIPKKEGLAALRKAENLEIQVEEWDMAAEDYYQEIERYILKKVLPNPTLARRAVLWAPPCSCPCPLPSLPPGTRARATGQT
jgi:hypothetical protein